MISPQRGSVVRTLLIFTSTIILFAGCHTIKLDISERPKGEIVKDRKSYFLFGIAPTRNVDVSRICPAGTVSITENTSFFDGFLGLLTLGMYTPRTTAYECARGE